MWLQQHHQSLLTELFQAALVKLCLENVPFSGNLELDGLFCISNDDVSKQIVVKIHKVIQPSSAYQGKSRSILKINQTAHDTDEYGKQKDTALVVEVRRGKVGDSIMYKSEHSCDIGNSTKDFISANRNNDKSAKTDSMTLEVPLNSTVASTNGSGIVAVDLSINSPSSQDNTGSVGISHIKEEQMQEMSMCDEDSVGESLHIQDNDDIHSEMKCKLCQLNFSDLGDLETHLRENHGRFMCRKCLKTFSLSCNLRRHMKLHTGVRPHVCNSCNSSFSRSTDLKIHMKKHSSGKDSFSCSLCSVIFSNSYLLSQHKVMFHGSDEERFNCRTCEKQFSSESNLMQHQKVHRESRGSEADKSALNQSPNMTSDEQEAVIAGDEDEMSFEDGSNCSGSPSRRSPASWTAAHLAEKVCPTKQTVQRVEEKQNLPLDFKINHFESKLGKEMPNAYMETVKEFAPLFTIDDPDVANGSCSRDVLAKSSENLQRALSLVQKRLSFATPAVGKNKRKGMPVKHVKLNENGTSYETADDQALHHNNESDDDSDGNVSNGNTASNCEEMICKTNSKLQLNERNMDSSHDGLKDGEFSMSKFHKSAFLLDKNNANIKLEKQVESYSASTDLSLNSNNAENRIFTCRHGGCSTAWFGFAAYESHYISAHCRYPCELCDQSFTSRNNRRRHANGHGNAKRHSCDICDKQFARPDIVKEHRITHTKSYQGGCCFKCEFACVKKTMLLSHLKRCLSAEEVDSDIAKR